VVTDGRQDDLTMTISTFDTTRSPRIVVGFDGTESGLDAVALGRRLAEGAGARLIVTYVPAFNAVVVPAAAGNPVIERTLHDAAEAVVGRVAGGLEGFENWTRRIHPAIPPARGLHEVAEKEGADLIVVGSTHRRGTGRIVPGTTAEKLLHGSHLPILLAPAGWRQRPGCAFSTLGAGFDGSVQSESALSAAAALARLTGASLRAIAAFEAPDPANPIFALTGHGYREIVGDMRAAVARRLDDAAAPLQETVDVRTEVLDGDPADVLAAESAELDLLAVGSRGYGAIRSVMLGTHTGELIWRSSCPLLVVPRGVADPLASFKPLRRAVA
jgi:nucleotide-binding universal stress UspA family protein